MQSSARGPGFSPLVRNLVVGVALPYVATVLLQKRGVSLPIALAVAAVFPLADIVYEYVRTRHLGAVDVLSLVGLVAGIATSFITGDPRFALAKESFLTGVFGAGFLVTLALPRPAIFYLARQTEKNPERFEDLWRIAPLFRSTMRRMTLFWGLGLLGEALVRIVCVMTLPPNLMVTLSPAIAIVAFGGLGVVSALWAKRARTRGEALEAAVNAASPGTTR